MDANTLIEKFLELVHVCEMKYGSFEIEANREAAKAGDLSKILDALIDSYLETSTPAERIIRKLMLKHMRKMGE